MNMNKFELLNLVEECRNYVITGLESDIREYIKSEWSDDLDFYVEYTGYDIEITVMDSDFDYKRFEFFILKELVKKYNCELISREVVCNPVSNELLYCEWNIG